jgi:hypothetical protein
MDTTDKAQAAAAIPGDIHSIASEIVKAVGAFGDMRAENSGRIEELITKTLVERIAVFDDVRMGRIMGSAISMI